MNFKMAHCLACGDYVFDESKIVSFRTKGDTIEIVPLNGREPWSGIRSICRTCLKVLEGDKGVVPTGTERSEVSPSGA